MSDNVPEPDSTTPCSGATAPRRAPDLLTLAAGLTALGIAGNALIGGMGWLPGIDARWVLAAVAILVGLAMVIGSIRPRSTAR